jgi:ComF family protein
MFGNASGLVNRGAATVIAAWLDRLHRALLPSTCLLCGAVGTAGRDLCAGCAAALPRNLAPCPHCALPLADGRTGPCDPCRSRIQTFDRAFAPFRYQPPVDFLLRRLKFDGRLSHARLLGELLAAALAERGDPPPDCIVPVPLHPLRLRERGFNQALELARAPARHFRIPLVAAGLRRVRHTAPQTQLDARGRLTNPLGAFALGRPLHGSRVALVDDVMTTGSTVAECARVLRVGGATEIEVWAIGRAGAWY